jgi:hypothetical protein
MEAKPSEGLTAASQVERRITDLEADLFQRIEGDGILPHRKLDPEVVRVWGRIIDDLTDLRGFIQSSRSAKPGAVAQLSDLLGSRPDRSQPWKLAFARQFSASLRALVPLFADREYLGAVLLATKFEKRFRKVYGDDALERARKAVLETPSDAREINRVAVQLRMVHLYRANERLKSHTRLALRSGALGAMLMILLPMVIGAGLTFGFAENTTGWNVAVAAAAGVLGSILSGFFKLRDQLDSLTELRSFRAALIVQPAIGAATGLLAFLLVWAGVLHLPPSDEPPSTATFGVYGFLAGFSEPFFLSVVERLTGGSGTSK